MTPNKEDNLDGGEPDGERSKAAATTDNTPKATESHPSDHSDEAAFLRNITADIRDQDDLERDITTQANAVLVEAEDKKDKQRIEKLEANKEKLEAKRVEQQKKLEGARRNPYQSRSIQKEIDKLGLEIDCIIDDISDCQARIDKRQEEVAVIEDPAKSKSRKLPGESNREFLVRTGKITPFANIGGERPAGFDGELADVLVEAEENAAAEEFRSDDEEPKSHQVLRMPGFAEQPEPAPVSIESEFSLRPRKKRRMEHDASSDDFEPTAASSPESQYASDTSEEEATGRKRKKGKAKKKAADTTVTVDGARIDLSSVDDGNEAVYQARLADWVRRRSRARQHRNGVDGVPSVEDDGEEEWFKPSPDHPDHEFGNNLKLPGDIHPSLFAYQKTGVHWLAELYEQGVGGIIGDEMGLGKTVQAIAFVAALHYSKKLDKPVIVVVPATVMQQWVNEFHRWWPALRVSILHSSGSGMINVNEDDDDKSYYGSGKNGPAAHQIIKRVVRHGHVLVTTYAGLHSYNDELLSHEWGYAILDEGHKIRNPNAEVTIACKKLNTPHRLILSGTPIQNNLVELWSLFDFIYPMRLGTLVNFRHQFEMPIRMGGHANATNLAVLTAEKCATTLKETISQYLLQRLKTDVASDLPEKTEQVLFCKLTPEQNEEYIRFIHSDAVSQIMAKKRQALYGIDILRKICNHPDLVNVRKKGQPGYDWGSPRRSGKLQMVGELLPMWKRFGHKTLLFSQTKIMLDILQEFIGRMQGMTYLRMDGEVAVDKRQALIDRFNNDPSIDVFLLTTKTGGLGVNLTGATRIVIYDPDWNPSTDLQARERAWRLGQTKPVAIYRLMTSGTIEEKIYHRQIFKQFMTNKVLKDPKQRANFDLSDLYDLFSFGDNSHSMASANRSKVFEGAEVKYNESEKPSKNAVPISSVNADDEVNTVRKLAGVAAVEEFTEDKTPEDEKRITESLFSRTVESAYEHDQIMNGKKRVQADPVMNQREARRFAAQAEAALRQAGEVARRTPIGTVTWTGEVGEAGRPIAQRRRGGVNSSSVMSALADRQGLSAPASGASSRSGTPGVEKNFKEKDFVPLIQTFIRRQGGKAPSKMVVDHFNPYCQKPKQIGEFKSALDKVAVLSKSGGTGRGVWTLRPAYK
ncbi:DNA repair and recombination protein rad26 [Colletotrichum tofieldiae]|uniref:DNA repair and recombination protein rad26 (SNF2 super family protein) n=1 Tax=Colletotrichum tofieldiae TaxID=708197 RepID=A0A166Y311_9PEZI|nr:DNA repair and recombination protein rad26 (SNF2 super family protein) [Colletotrichum tofieldiae]GKT53935.1 DNA repair and recombination protein Rad26 [Colletotrichum tofieldiae]GKT73670.1 DNA repair and recombination protein rad26 [Colletotrichum tofieldiae]